MLQLSCLHGSCWPLLRLAAQHFFSEWAYVIISFDHVNFKWCCPSARVKETLMTIYLHFDSSNFSWFFSMSFHSQKLKCSLLLMNEDIIWLNNEHEQHKNLRINIEMISKPSEVLLNGSCISEPMCQNVCEMFNGDVCCATHTFYLPSISCDTIHIWGPEMNWVLDFVIVQITEKSRHLTGVLTGNLHKIEPKLHFNRWIFIKLRPLSGIYDISMRSSTVQRDTSHIFNVFSRSPSGIIRNNRLS